MNKKIKYGIRKLSVGVASVAIGLSFMTVAAYAEGNLGAAETVNIKYNYVNENDLSQNEKAFIETEISKIRAKDNASYYIVYKNESAKNAINAVKTNDDSDPRALAALLGASFIVIGVAAGKKKKKTAISLLAITLIGGSTFFYGASALEAMNITFTENHNVKVGDALPIPNSMNGQYKIVGFIPGYKIDGIANDNGLDIIDNNIDDNEKEGDNDNVGAQPSDNELNPSIPSEGNGKDTVDNSGSSNNQADNSESETRPSEPVVNTGDAEPEKPESPDKTKLDETTPSDSQPAEPEGTNDKDEGSSEEPAKPDDSDANNGAETTEGNDSAPALPPSTDDNKPKPDETTPRDPQPTEPENSDGEKPDSTEEPVD